MDSYEQFNFHITKIK